MATARLKINTAHGAKVRLGMKRAARGVLSPAAQQRKERIAKGLCGACGKRKRAKGRPECRRCIAYYRKLAQARAEKLRAIREVKVKAK